LTTTRRPALALGVLLLATGCGGTAQHAARTGTPSGTAARTLDEHDAGTTVTVRRGDTVTLALHSTYWALAGSSDPAVLAAEGAPVLHPAAPGRCLPGMGCGSVTELFTARADGTARLSADRTSCGEALACRPEQAHYAVTVRVVS
jgi:hypothetical protein